MLYWQPELVQPHLQYVLEEEMPFLKEFPLSDMDYGHLIGNWGSKAMSESKTECVSDSKCEFMELDKFVVWWNMVSRT